MQPASIPANESERIAAVRRYDILDTDAEAVFDDFTRIASHICGTPMATISLIDTAREWFKSTVGLEATELPRELTFCAHAILGDGIFEVPNALEDERFRDNPFVVGDPNVRFYAGAPLVTPDGLNIGTLCVVDRMPHHLTPEQREALAVLSRQVVQLLELRLAGRRIKWMNENLEQLVAKRTEELRESEERFRQLAEQSSDVFWFVGLNPRRILYVSPAVEKIWGRPADQFYDDPRTWFSSIHPGDQERIRDSYQVALSSGATRFETEFRVIQPNGTVRWVANSGTPIRNSAGEIIRIGGMAKDITDRRQAEGQRLRAQRLESIGTLAGGIAHDLNNSLAPILMVTGMLRMKYPEDAEMIDNLELSAKRGADMVRQLLTFAKGVEGERLVVDPPRLLKEMARIIQGTFPKNIQLRTTCAKDLHSVRGDATQLHQVLLNLCVNARDAMPGGGTLTLEAENTTIDSAHALMVPDAKPGPYVLWRVTDTGTGIPPDILERIFEPFFSTKGPDQGTGLGLSTVIGIVKSHGGFVQIHSTPGQGSTFAVYLPAERSSAAEVSSRGKSKPDFTGHGETILVVDDEASVRQAARAVLSSLDFKVLTAANGAEALVQVAEKRAELRAVITDLHMPLLDGLAFVRMLKGTLPEAGIIVATGRMEEREANEFRALGVDVLLDKPFTQEALEEALKVIFSK
jgi:PAS domain S-box-containing protein